MKKKCITSLNDSLTNIWETIYPVGSIYISASSTSPEDLFGGEWEQIQDCFLMAAGSTYAAGTTGGSNTITLDKSQIPSLDITGSTAQTTTVAANSVGSTSNAGTHTHTTNTYTSHSSVATDMGSYWTANYINSAKQNVQSSSSGAHTHTLNIPALTVNSATVTATYTNDSQVTVDVTNAYLSVYVWKRVN